MAFAATHTTNTVEEQLFSTSRLKAAFGLAGSALFVVLGVPLLEERPLLGYLGVCFFGLCGVGALLMLTTNRYFLRLTPDGLEMSAFLRRRKYRWSDLEHFSVHRVMGSKLIAINSRSARSPGLWNRVSIANHYSAPIEAVCTALNSWRERYSHGRTED